MLAMDADGDSVACTGRQNHAVVFFITQTGKVKWVRSLEPLVPGDEEISSLVMSPSGKHLACASTGGKIAIWDLRKDTMRKVALKGLPALAFSPDGRMFAAVGNRIDGERNDLFGFGECTIWDLTNGQVVHTMSERRDESFWSITFSPNSQKIAIAGSVNTQSLGGELWSPKHWIWILALGARKSEGFEVEGLADFLAFNPDGSRLAWCHDNLVTIGDVVDKLP